MTGPNCSCLLFIFILELYMLDLMWVCACQLLISVKHVCVCAHCKKKVDYVFKTATKTVLETWFRMEYIFVIKVTILFVAKGQPNPNKNLRKQCKVEN